MNFSYSIISSQAYTIFINSFFILLDSKNNSDIFISKTHMFKYNKGNNNTKESAMHLITRLFDVIFI